MDESFLWLSSLWLNWYLTQVEKKLKKKIGKEK